MGFTCKKCGQFWLSLETLKDHPCQIGGINISDMHTIKDMKAAKEILANEILDKVRAFEDEYDVTVTDIDTFRSDPIGHKSKTIIVTLLVDI